MVLNNVGVKEALNQGDIEIIKYTWDDRRIILEKFLPGELKGSHKIRLHVGYIVRVLSDKRWIDPRVLHNKRDGIIDLRKLEERKYVMKPKESVILFTNEVVKFGPDYFGLILAKVSLEETGLTIAHSYVDPNWDGVLQLIVTNNSEREILLQEHGEIANLIVMRMEQSADETSVKKNDHYAVTWEIIRDDATLPKWTDRKRSLGLKVIHGIRTRWKLFIGLGVPALATLAYQIIGMLIDVFNV